MFRYRRRSKKYGRLPLIARGKVQSKVTTAAQTDVVGSTVPYQRRRRRSAARDGHWLRGASVDAVEGDTMGSVTLLNSRTLLLAVSTTQRLP